MFAVSQVMYKPIVTLDSGERIDRVCDVLFDDTAHQVVGLMVDEGGFWHDARFVPLGSVHSVGENNIVVPGKRSVVNVSSQPQAIQAMQSGGSPLRGKKVVTEGGRNLGVLEDVQFQAGTGTVDTLEVVSESGEELLAVQAGDVQRVGDDMILVSDMATQHIPL